MKATKDGYDFIGRIREDATLPLSATRENTGFFTKTLVETAPGKNLITYRGWMSMKEFGSLWSKSLGVPAKYVELPEGQFVANIPPSLKVEMDECFLYWGEFGYEGKADPTVIHPKAHLPSRATGMALRYTSASSEASALAQPLKFKFSGLEASNRFLKAATTERLGTWNTKRESIGIPTNESIELYKIWGAGGFGVIVTGNIMIAEDHLEAAGNLIIPATASTSPGDVRFQAFRELALISKSKGSLLIGQLNHPGRQTTVEYQANPVSVSDIPMSTGTGFKFGPPHAACQEEIDEIVEGFAHSAEYLYKAGWDGIQIHGAHGYLLASFLSPSTNNRTDKYGGTVENRARLILEVTEAIRKRVPASFSLSIKINSVEFQDGGLSTADAKKFCDILEKQSRFDFIELSGGNYERTAWVHRRESSRKREAYFLYFAELIRPLLKETRSYVTGGFQTVGGMVNALRFVDGVGIARAACQEPNLPRDILTRKATGVIKQKLDQDDFMITSLAAGTQLEQIAHGFNPIDFSVQSNVDAFLQDMGKWFQNLQADSEQNMQGFDSQALQEAIKPSTFNYFKQQ
ncbi:hypothetical protein F5884DRAFT_903102 [Xylogone sp. PMI_703]|nr:hypothetical protein F5884DRAFT_903102 [Xylogone sp. PMI_703]